MFVDHHKDRIIIKQIQRTNCASGTTFVFWWGSGDQFLNASGLMSEAEGVVQPQEIGLGARGLAHMQGTPILLHEAGRDAALHRQHLAQAGPGEES